MENEVKVFHSGISRVDCEEENNLYELLKIVPAKPVAQRSHNSRNDSWEFFPNKDKHFIPRTRKGSKLKVKTVRDIRTLYEKEIYSYLPDDLEQQQNYLLKKIRDGCLFEEKTRETAIKLLNANNPISRSAWQMVANINPEKHNHSKQFVLWNGKCIQVNGSRGGKTKFICNFDLKNKQKTKLRSTSNLKKKVSKSRIGLLRNSLNVKFRPGPLKKKKFLDASHHKYQMGDIELVMLPTPVLEISTAYGTVLEPAISSFINDLRGKKGAVSQKLAEFAVSALGTIENNTPVQLNKKCVSFNLNYKCNQNRLLMRRSIADTKWYTNVENESNETGNFTKTPITRNTDITFSDESISEIKKVMDEMLDCIEISLKQDSMFSTDDEARENIADDSKDLYAIKDKHKRKYCELDKLHVTVIKLPGSYQNDCTKPCGKSFCTLGCICESIDCAFTLKQHCGVLDCMFDCKCPVSKYRNIELLERDCSDIIPGLLNLDNEINSHLAKEEQKFHQTVIVSGEKSILLKSQKRNWKSSKKYADFYSKMNLTSDENIKRILTVDIQRLNCENVEPYCMVHSLYKCFCKGKFTESCVCNNVTEISATKILNDEHTKVENEVTIQNDKGSDTKASIKPRPRRSYDRTKSVSKSNEVVKLSSNSEYNDSSCARTMCYNGRKYTDGYYINTNNRIMEMEKNDSLLRKKMLRLINGANDDVLLISDTPGSSTEILKNDESVNITLNKSRESSNEDLDKTVNRSGEKNNEVLNKPVNKSGEISYPFATATGKSSLKNWLETSYKSYKEKLVQGVLKNSLDAPKKGKAALQSWDFILSRYRERKNIFFVSKQEPFRTFLAVDDKHPFFANCINIDDIRFADLPKYPLIIRNLVTNATDSENSFCILRGWDHCWELIGSAVKVIERIAGNKSEPEVAIGTNKLMVQDDSEEDDWIDQRTLFNSESTSLEDDTDCNQIEQDTQSERSKWFVMTVENDFTEIQFYKRGFYVTYDGIQRSISLARISGKTVRLSSHARADKNSTHQFGIYAIPCVSECCVFIGPYEINEPLGIEVVKTFFDPRKKRKTRGVWITTNKFDNLKVIEHPLSFLPSASIPNDAMVTLDSGFNTYTEQLETSKKGEQNQVLPMLLKSKSDLDKSKIVKPIKIRKTNGFYHLSNNLLQKITPNKKSLVINKSITVSKNAVVSKNALSLLKKSSGDSNSSTSTTNSKPVAEIAPQVINLGESIPTSSVTCIRPVVEIRPVAEISPQIKITCVYSESNLQKNHENSEINTRSGMLVLKPEEINKKVLAKTTANDEIGTDIEKFLETSTICIAPDEVLVISDGEDEETVTWKDVWIQCLNVENFGWIRGRMNDDKLLSFEFPGFKYSDFYIESEAFEKINQVLARKIYVPKNFKLQWRVILDEEYVTCDMLTPPCLEDKRYLLIRFREQREKKAKLKKKNSVKPGKKNKAGAGVKGATATDSVHKGAQSERRNETVTLMEGLEQASRELEQQSAILWNKAVTKRNEIISSLSVPDNLKAGMTETLQGIMSMNKQ